MSNVCPNSMQGQSFCCDDVIKATRGNFSVLLVLEMGLSESIRVSLGLALTIATISNSVSGFLENLW